MVEKSGMENPRPGRAFWAAAAVVFVVATAAGLLSYRACTEKWAGLESIPLPGRPWPNPWAIEQLRRITTWAPLWLAPYTVALLLLRLWRPRTRLPRLAREPGFVACVAASSVLAVGMAVIFPLLAVGYLPLWPVGYWAAYSWPLFFRCAFDLRLPTLMAAAVAGGWAVLRLTGRWRADRSWLDRLGRVLGWCWVALLVVHCFLDPWLYLSHHFRDPLAGIIKAIARNP